MISGAVSRASAGVLLVGGLGLLFAPDLVLPPIVPEYPPAGFWVGQLLGAAWLGLAALNWLNRFVLLGGIYGRGVVSANAIAYFITTLVLLRAGFGDPKASGVWGIGVVAALPALVYGWLLFRGPAEADLNAHRRQAGE